jgi:ABC-2 type transport system permease protein
MKKVLAIGGVNLRRLTRDRIGAFFVFVFPIVLILLLGLAFGGDFTLRVGVVSRGDGPLEETMYGDIAAGRGLEVERISEPATLVEAVERGVVDAGVVIPEGYDDTLRSDGTAQVRYIARPGELSTALRTTVDSAVAEQAAIVRAARFASLQWADDFDAALMRAEAIADRLPGVDVSVTSAGGGEVDEDVGRFDLGASSQLILFVFVNSLAYSASLIQTRQLGLSRRMLSTPLGAGTILVGEGLGRFSVAMVQGAFIVVVAALLFGVDWGDPLAASVLIVAFALVSTGAAMLFGAILKNEQQAGALVPLGLALAALGGCMVPLEVFSPTMRTIAHLTPHAWAIEGFTELIRRDAGLADILPQIVALLGFAAVLLSLASWRLRRAIVG